MGDKDKNQEDEEFDDEDLELEAIIQNQPQNPRFRSFRRIPSLSISRTAETVDDLEIDLENVPTRRTNDDEKEPAYTMADKYAGGKNGDAYKENPYQNNTTSPTPKPFTAPTVNPFMSGTFTDSQRMNAASSSFRNTNGLASSEYPDGTFDPTKSYDPGKDQMDRRRRM